jgi:hypothetical protein
MFAFLSPVPVPVPAGFTATTSDRWCRPTRPAVRPHPKRMRILNDTAVAGHDDADIDAALTGSR